MKIEKKVNCVVNVIYGPQFKISWKCSDPFDGMSGRIAAALNSDKKAVILDTISPDVEVDDVKTIVDLSNAIFVEVIKLNESGLVLPTGPRIVLPDKGHLQ